MCQLPGAAVVLEMKPPDVVLHFLQLLLSMLDMDLTPPPLDYLCLEGAVHDTSHGVIDIIVQGMVEVKEGELSGAVGSYWVVGIVRGSVDVFEVGVGVTLQLPINNGVVRPLYVNVECLHCFPAWQRDLEVDEVGPLVQDKA